MYFAPGIRAAMYRLPWTGTARSPTLWMMSVGTRIAGNTWRTSMSAIMLQIVLAALGLADCRT